jgi:lipopolysaccharide assembly outer membrane protein LptD (OstA)
MKFFAVALILVACVSLSAQDQAAKPLERWICGEGKCQTATDPLPEGAQILVTLTANRIEGENTLRLRGGVEISTRVLVLQADEAEYQWATGEITARGNVRIKPAAPPSAALPSEGSRVRRTDFPASGNGAIVAPSPTSSGIRVRQFAQTPDATLGALSVTHDGDVFHLKGAVQIGTNAFSVTADEAAYQESNGEIEAQGELRVKPAPLVSPGLAQFGIK